jgi:hypothetical protein
MSLVNHAETELKAAGLFDKDSDYDGMLGDTVLELIKVFAKQGHSGYSASLCTELFYKLSKYQPLLPLTGEDSEWFDISDMSGEPMFQNIRNSAVFKDNDNAYYLDGKRCVEPDGCSYSKKTPINFPYDAKTITVKVDWDGNEISDDQSAALALSGRPLELLTD